MSNRSHERRALRAESSKLSHRDLRSQEPELVILSSSMRLGTECRDGKQWWRLMDKPGFVCKLYTVSYDTYVQPVLKGHHFRRVFVTNIFDIDVAGLVAGGAVILCVLHVVDQKKVHRMCFRCSRFDHGFATGYVHIGPRQTIFDLPMSDGRQLQTLRVFPFHEATDCHM